MNEINRAADEMRMVRIVPDYTEMAAGSVLICCGRTRVICTASVQEGVPSFLRGKGKGWLTAEYAMLPGATSQRKPRDGVKKDGRGVEPGSMAYSAVSQPLPLPRRKPGTPSCTEAVQITLVLPQVISAEPAAMSV